MQHRTSSRNYICSELVSVARLSGNGAGPTLTGNLEEIGEWSALVLVEASVARGTKVRVKSEAHTLEGFVRSCTFDRLLGYFIEIGLDTASRWSEKWFVPQHLFTLCPSMRYFTYAGPQVPEKFVPVKTAHA